MALPGTPVGDLIHRRALSSANRPGDPYHHPLGAMNPQFAHTRSLGAHEARCPGRPVMQSPGPPTEPRNPETQKCILKSEKWHFGRPGKMAQKVH